MLNIIYEISFQTEINNKETKYTRALGKISAKHYYIVSKHKEYMEFDSSDAIHEIVAENITIYRGTYKNCLRIFNEMLEAEKDTGWYTMPNTKGGEK